MPTVVERSRTWTGSRNSVRRVIRAPSLRHTEEDTVPTGLSSVPPSGPAIPVIPMPASAWTRDTAPEARAAATWARHRPDATQVRNDQTASAVLASFEYTTTPPAEYVTTRALGEPRRHQAALHDWATATIRPEQPSDPPIDRRSVARADN